MSEKRLKGTIQISQALNSYDDETPIRLRIEDELSSSEVIEVRMSREALADALTGRGYNPCEFVLRPQVCGMKREHKTEIVTMPKNCKYKDEKAAKKAMKPFEVDGWEGRISDCFNSHKLVDGSTNRYKVSFVRHVPVE